MKTLTQLTLMIDRFGECCDDNWKNLLAVVSKCRDILSTFLWLFTNLTRELHRQHPKPTNSH